MLVNLKSNLHVVNVKGLLKMTQYYVAKIIVSRRNLFYGYDNNFSTFSLQEAKLFSDYREVLQIVHKYNRNSDLQAKVEDVSVTITLAEEIENDNENDED